MVFLGANGEIVVCFQGRNYNGQNGWFFSGKLCIPNADAFIQGMMRFLRQHIL